MRRLLCVPLAIAACLVATTPAHAGPPSGGGGGCAAFGVNVATLATTLGGQFGVTAASVATSGPKAFPAPVVRPEQAALCD
jgi:hypothetical protein